MPYKYAMYDYPIVVNNAESTFFGISGKIIDYNVIFDPKISNYTNCYLLQMDEGSIRWFQEDELTKIVPEKSTSSDSVRDEKNSELEIFLNSLYNILIAKYSKDIVVKNLQKLLEKIQ